MPETAPKQTCPSCGARVAAAAEVCDLCGTALPASEAEASAGAPSASRGVYCNACGWKNPPGARYCSQCGERLQAPALAAPPKAPPAPAAAVPPQEADRREGLSRRVVLLVGVAVLMVAGLFVITTLSKGSGSTPAEDAATGQPAPTSGASVAGPEALIQARKADPLPSDLAAQADSLQAAVAGPEGDARRQAQRALVNLYLGAGRLDRAAIAEREIAQAEGTAEAWERAASLLYDWMSAAQSQQERFEVAALTAEAYERVVEKRPEDLGLRTNMAMAYLSTRTSPMRGINEIKRVLEEDPDHVQALFVYGYALAQIGRTEQAIEQFEQARRAAGEGSSRYEQATQIIQALREQSGQHGSEESGGPDLDAPSGAP